MKKRNKSKFWLDFFIGAVTTLSVLGVAFAITITYYPQTIYNSVNSVTKKHLQAYEYDNNNIEGPITKYKGLTRWRTNSATVYVDPIQDPAYIQAYNKALDVWNSYGVFRFERVNNENEARIVLSHRKMDKSSDGSITLGATGNRYYQLYNYLSRSYVDFNDNGMYLKSGKPRYNQDVFVSVAIHELGHAIGLEHSHDEASVMYSSSDNVFVDYIDQHTIDEVKKLYKN